MRDTDQIMDGDIIRVTEQNFTTEGVVIGAEYDDLEDDHADVWIVVDFGGMAPGRIPLDEDGNLPTNFHHVPVR
jgi:hypothetical protein